MQWPDVAPVVPPVNADKLTSPSEAVLPTVEISSPNRACHFVTPPYALNDRPSRCNVDERCGFVVAACPVTAVVPGAVPVASSSALRVVLDHGVTAIVESRASTIIVGLDVDAASPPM
jgi:hypothetical protein